MRLPLKFCGHCGHIKQIKLLQFCCGEVSYFNFLTIEIDIKVPYQTKKLLLHKLESQM